MQNARTGTETANARQMPRPPAGVVTVSYLAICIAPLVLASTRSVAPSVAWDLFAAGLGLVGLATLAVQFVTSGRFQIVSGKIGIDHVMAFHKTAAWWVLLALVLHPVVYVVPTFLAEPALGYERLWAYLTLPHYRGGVIAASALILLVLSAGFRRRLPLRYEIWRGAHLVLAAVALGAGLHHAVTVGRFSAAGFLNGYWWALGIAAAGVIAVLYGWRWARLHLRPWRLVSVSKLADRTWELDIQPGPRTPPLGYRAGQFVWMTEGARRFPLFDHPFSIADNPARPGLSLIVKEAGDFTNRIDELSPGTLIGIDGPYGHFIIENHADDAVLLIAGGVGIAPIMGLLRDLVARGYRHPVRLAYAAGAPENFACIDEISAAGATLDLRTLLLSETPGQGWTGETGMLDRDRLSNMLEGLDRQRTVALICGPGPMITAVADGLIDLGMPMARIKYERFDYSAGASRLDRRMQRRFMLLALGLAVGIAGFVLIMIEDLVLAL
jgi:predicted ferric reductase